MRFTNHNKIMIRIYILHVKTADEDAQTLNIVVKH